MHIKPSPEGTVFISFLPLGREHLSLLPRAPQAVLAGSVAAMDGQPDAELRKQDDQMDCEREPAGMSSDEWKSWKRGQVRRNTLHLVSAAAQWILLLACVVYLGLDSLQLSTVRARVPPVLCWPVNFCMGFSVRKENNKKKAFRLTLF